jgi:hypothetical protein
MNAANTPVKGRWEDHLSILIFIVFAILALRYQGRLLHYREFGDEAETIVVAKMLAAGQTLYSEIFNHHGPLVFLSGYVLEKFASFGVAAHRVPIALLQIAALISIYGSPLLSGASGFIRRLYVMLAAAAMLIYFPDFGYAGYGHMYLYQVQCGLFLTIILAQYTLPALLLPEKLTRRHIVLGNILLGALPFFAVTYAPMALLLFLAALRKEWATKAAIVFAGSMLANIVFLAWIGSIPGFLAYHIYLNFQIMPFYGLESGTQLIWAALRNLTWDMPMFTCALVFVWTMSALAARAPSHGGRSCSPSAWAVC